MGNGSSLGQAANARTPSRIEQDVENVKLMSDRIEQLTSRITAHARALGYFGPPQDANKAVNAAPTAVITTMSDALGSLSHEIDKCSGALNVFD